EARNPPLEDASHRRVHLFPSTSVAAMNVDVEENHSDETCFAERMVSSRRSHPHSASPATHVASQIGESLVSWLGGELGAAVRQ
ncbi:MAG TPA: hypothetical protein VLA89_04750, partial [Gemmatimonadales bacterium]|nr:hypothetical protein [Gemmatimonadales bacterium]